MISAALFDLIKQYNVIGVSVGRKDDKTTWRLDFSDIASAQDKTQAKAVMDTFDYTKVTAPKTLDQRLSELEAKVK